MGAGCVFFALLFCFVCVLGSGSFLLGGVRAVLALLLLVVVARIPPRQR